MVLVNEAFARQLLPGEDPIGKRFRYGTTGKWRQIAGVVEDGKYRSLGEAPAPTVFQDMEQDWRSNETLVARSASAGSGNRPPVAARSRRARPVADRLSSPAV